MADYDEITEGAAKSADPLIFARELAAALAEYSASASARGSAQPVAPAEAARRKAAHEEMTALLAEYEANGTTPRYRITTAPPGGFFVDDILIEGGQVIEFAGIPNQEMEALNAPGQKVLSLYMQSIGGVIDLGEETYNAYANRPRHASIVGQRPEPPPLGTPRSTSRVHVVDPAQRDEPPQENGGMHVRYGNRPRDPQTGRLIPLDKST